MNYLILLILIFILTFLTACTKPDPKPEPIKEAPLEAQIATEEAIEVKRQAVFTYTDKRDLKPRVRVRLNQDPVLVGEDYIRLSGILYGNSPIACLEIGGAEGLFEAGDMVGDYFVSRIYKKEVVLCLKK